MFALDSIVRLKVLFTTDGAPVDPTAVTLLVVSPAGVKSTYVYGTDAAVVRDGVGAFHADLPASIDGKWLCCWRGTGAVIAATPDFAWFVSSSVFGP